MADGAPSSVYLNGRFVPLGEARISVMDRGFLFGDGVYEVIPCFGGRLFRLEHHLRRLDESLSAVRMDNPLPWDAWESILKQLVAQTPGEDQSVYLQVTRGTAAERDHAIPESIEPTVFAMTATLKQVSPDITKNGISAVCLEDIRWQRCNIKAVTLLANILLRQEAKELGGNEALLIRNGLAYEGAASNLFAVTGGVLTTPPESRFLLPGVTRNLVLELAMGNRIPAREADIPVEYLRRADEIWLTSSTKEIMPVTRLDGEKVGSGTPGPLFREINRLYQEYKARLKAGTAA